MKLTNRVKKWNEAAAERLTVVVGSMWCAYAFFLFSLVPLVWPASAATVQYVSGAIVQLVLLPVIMVGGSVLNRSTERRARADHEALKAILEKLDINVRETRRSVKLSASTTDGV